jgi:hypothetical protein
VVCPEPGQGACGPGWREPEAKTISLPGARGSIPARVGRRGYSWAGCPWLGALIASHLSTLLPPAPDEVTWPWRLRLVAFGLTTAVLAALVASATLLPPTATTTPGTCFRATDRPGPAGTEARAGAKHRPAGAAHLADPAGPHPDAVPRTGSRPARAQAPAAPGATTLAEVFSTVDATTQPLVTASTTTAAPTTTAPPPRPRPRPRWPPRPERAHHQGADHDRRRADHHHEAGDPLTVGSQQTSQRHNGGSHERLSTRRGGRTAHRGGTASLPGGAAGTTAARSTPPLPS